MRSSLLRTTLDCGSRLVWRAMAGAGGARARGRRSCERDFVSAPSSTLPKHPPPVAPKGWRGPCLAVPCRRPCVTDIAQLRRPAGFRRFRDSFSLAVWRMGGVRLIQAWQRMVMRTAMALRETDPDGPLGGDEL